MPRTTISPTNLPGGSAAGVGFQVFTWTAADVANGNQFASTGKEILFARNVNTGSPLGTFKVTLYKTNGQIEYTVGISGYVSTGQIPTSGWKQSNGFINVDAPSTDIEFAVLVMP